ncbi:MAG: GMC oxidoreductase [Nodosilinea sp.]
MFLDARQIASQDVIDTTLCIVGAGPAGITIAREFSGQDMKVLLLESGGFDPDPEALALADGTNEGDPYPPPIYMRERQFGGTANAWPIDLGNGRIGVRYVPLDPIDFEKRDWVPHSGWPISRADLDPYYEKAHGVAQTGPYNYDPAHWEEPGAEQIPFRGDRVTTQMFHFGPRDVFTHEYRRELEQSPNVTLMTYATVLELETDDLALRVTGLRVGALGGAGFRVTAKVVILAQGGLETARLLLLSDAVQTGGLGNDHDLVGRFLMDHPVIRPGVLVPQDRQVMDRLALYDARWVKGARVIAKPVLTEATQRQEKLLNINTAIFPRPAWMRHNPLRMVLRKGKRPASPAVESAQVLTKALKTRQFPTAGLRHAGRVLAGLDDLTYFQWRKGQNRFRHRPLCGYDFDHGGWSELEDKPKKFGCFDLLHITEQAPDPNNRLTLSADRDALGCRKIALHWRYNDIEQRSVKRAMEIFAEEFAAAGLGRMRFELDHGTPAIWSPSIHHNMGTTRMHDSPTQGVVDGDCRVHGVSNLFIASSSVFPTGGYANSTLTILALALRLADHVKGHLEQTSMIFEKQPEATSLTD